jgi:hypothetical protein
MSLDNNSRREIKKLYAALREQRLEEEKQFGRPRSKTWGGRASSKEDRRKSKEKLKKMIDKDDYISGDE